MLAVEVYRTGLRFVDTLIGSPRERLGPARRPGRRTRSVGRDGEAQPRGLVLRPALLGFVAMVAIAIGASLPSSPFKLEMPGVWFFGVPRTT